VFFPHQKVGVELSAGFLGFSGISEGYDLPEENAGKDELESESIDIGLNISKVDLGLRFYF
jgi:hypothetical protein